MSKKLLQIFLGIIGLVPLITGIEGLLGGAFNRFYSVPFNNQILGNVILDSNLRYFSGVWLGLGIIVFWIIPNIERHTFMLRSICLMIFLGGVGRLISLFLIGNPSSLFVVFTILELVFPLFSIWQYQIVQSSKRLEQKVQPLIQP